MKLLMVNSNNIMAKPIQGAMLARRAPIITAGHAITMFTWNT